MNRVSTPIQASLWSEETDQWYIIPQLSGEPKPRSQHKAKPLPEVPTPTLWPQESSARPRTIAELQTFVATFQYQPRPVPIRSFQRADARLDVYRSGYEILHTNPASNLWSAYACRAEAIVSLSGGLGSAVAAERAIQKHGRENVLLWFADVLEENEDLYRFLHDLMKRWGGRLFWYTDGRRPVDIWTKHQLIPNSLIAPCTFELKVKPFRDFIQAMPSLPLVYIGYKPHETRRHKKTLQSYAEALPEAHVEYPLLWEPQEKRDLLEVCEQELGIDPPLLYKLGYDFNNCGGGCCRSGIKAWTRTALFFPTIFAHRSAWEQAARAQGGARENRSFAARTRDGEKQALTLQQIQEEYVPHAPSLLKLEA